MWLLAVSGKNSVGNPSALHKLCKDQVLDKRNQINARQLGQVLKGHKNSKFRHNYNISSTLTTTLIMSNKDSTEVLNTDCTQHVRCTSAVCATKAHIYKYFYLVMVTS
jgi:hypothetical protein